MSGSDRRATLRRRTVLLGGAGLGLGALSGCAGLTERISSTSRGALSVCVNLLAGFALAKLRFRGRSLVLGIVLATLVVPGQAIMIPQFQLVAGLDLIGLFWAVILPSAATTLGVFLARQFFVSLRA